MCRLLEWFQRKAGVPKHAENKHGDYNCYKFYHKLDQEEKAITHKSNKRSKTNSYYPAIIDPEDEEYASENENPQGNRFRFEKESSGERKGRSLLM